jgi:serine phosphatase RsbU (regulator of sigma subunit)
MPRPHFTPRPGPQELLSTLSRLAGEVQERTRRQQARAELAIAIQRTMLPDALPEPPGLRAAARYTPAREGLDVGGDWYDVFPMPGGTFGFVIGDVQGHDVEAAAFVGQVRTGLRVVTGLTTDPGEILARVNDLLVSMDASLFVTCTSSGSAPARGVLADARAGHVPSVRAEPGGTSEVVFDAGGLPLGIFPRQSYPVTRRRSGGPWVLVLLTDGVVEGPRFPLARGMARVASVARADARAGTGPEELATDVMAVADLTGHSDDAAVLVLCRTEP